MADSEKEVDDPQQQFAKHVINTVQQIYDLAPLTTSLHEKDLFTEKHRNAIESYQHSQEGNWVSAIEQTANGRFDHQAFQACLEHLTNIYKPEEYSEVGFVIFCSVIAFLGVYFSHKWKGSDGMKWAKDCIVSLLSDILSRGNLAESSW